MIDISLVGDFGPVAAAVAGAILVGLRLVREEVPLRWPLLAADLATFIAFTVWLVEAILDPQEGIPQLARSHPSFSAVLGVAAGFASGLISAGGLVGIAAVFSDNPDWERVADGALVVMAVAGAAIAVPLLLSYIS